MRYTESEKQILALLDRAETEYAAVERNEYPGKEADRALFRHHIDEARSIVHLRVLAREGKEVKLS